MAEEEKAAIYFYLSEHSEICRGFCSYKNLKLVGIYEEKKEDWESGNAKELLRLIEDAKKGTFITLVLMSLDTLSPFGAIPIVELWRLIILSGVTIISITETWVKEASNLSTIFEWIAAQESQHLSRVTKAGIAIKRQQRHGIWGRPKGSKDTKTRKRRCANAGTI